MLASRCLRTSVCALSSSETWRSIITYLLRRYPYLCALLSFTCSLARYVLSLLLRTFWLLVLAPVVVVWWACLLTAEYFDGRRDDEG